MRRRRLVTLIALGLVSLVAAACTGTVDPAAGGRAGAITVLAPSTPSSLSLDKLAGNDASMDLVVNTQANLIRFAYRPDAASGQTAQDSGRIEGVLARSWTISTDRRTVTFTLKDGVRSVAGHPLTADDVVWSFQRKAKAPTSLASFVFAPALTDVDRQIRKIDARTVSFSVAEPGYLTALLDVLANVFGGIYDSTLLRQHATTADPYAVDWTARSPANANFGFGPYRVAQIVDDQVMVLVANPGYVLGEPRIRTITYRVAAETGTRATSVRAGYGDIALSIRPADAAALVKAGVQVPRFDSALPNVQLILQVTNAPFGDRRVREAFAYAIPYQQIIDNVFAGRAEALTGYTDPALAGFTDGGPVRYRYDPARAKALLAAAGHPDGVTVTLTTTTAPPQNAAVLLQIQSFAEAAGFTIRIETMGDSEFYEKMADHHLQGLLMPGSGAFSSSRLFDLSAGFQPDAPRTNLSGWVDDAYLALLARATATTDPDEARMLLDQAEARLAAAVPIVQIARVDPANAYRDGLTGIALRTDGVLDFSVLSVGR